MVKLSQFAADHADAIAEIDLNPVLVHPKGQGVSVVDALIVKTVQGLSAHSGLTGRPSVYARRWMRG